MINKPFTRSRFPGSNNYQGNVHRHQFARRRPAASNIHSSKYIHNPLTQEVANGIAIKHTFADFPVDPVIQQNITSRGYSIPTPIQDQTIPLILSGRDVVGIANTGTGKTAAFLIPLLHKITQNRAEKILVVVPTRELAVQIDDEVRAFAKSLSINAVLAIGGASLNRQIWDLRRNPSIIIGTAGRLKDLIQRRMINLSLFTNIVLDEVDRMLDIGFIGEIKYIISLLPENRQSLFFSATVSPQIHSIIRSFLKNPITVSVKVQETAEHIEQDIIRVKDRQQKFEKLISLLRRAEFKKVLIFGRTKWGVERLGKTLQRYGFQVLSIHGNKSQNQRLRILSLFKENQLRILVATDVVARGLDISDVSHVINYDEPATYTDYIHRIGRTGRANKSGKALTFVGEDQGRRLYN